MASQRWILHADMDAFYASVEQRERPELRGKPVIVGANSARGVVAAASYEARQFGVRSAMPGFRARKLCPDGVFLPARMELYAAVSEEVHEVFDQFTPLVEPLALDEAFLDVSGSIHFFGGARQLGAELKRRVKERTALNVSVGLGPCKLVAKIACTLGKPNGLNVIEPGEVNALLRPLPIRRLWGIGPVLAQKLQGLGIATLGDLADYDGTALQGVLGSRAAELQARARGIDEAEVEPARIPKSCGEENTFETDVLAREAVSATLTAHAEAVAARLRAMGYRGRTVTLKIKLGTARGARVARFGDGEEPRYPLLSRSQTLLQATDDGKRIRDTALALWDEAAVAEPVRLLGVSLSNLEPRTPAQQLDLFARRPGVESSANEPRGDERLGATLDEINARFGKAAIRRAVDTPGKLTPSGRKRDP